MKIVESPDAPQAIGPYVHAIHAENYLFCSGQIALDSGGKMQNETLEKEIKQVLDNLGNVLTAGGTNPQKVVKTTIYLVDMEDFGVVNEVYGIFFGDHKPARATVAVKELPKGARVEIDCIAVV